MGYVSDFSPDGKLFALLDSDGRLKIWDVKDSRLTQEYLPNQHLSSPYTCFVWFSASVGKARNKKRNSGNTLYIALGTKKGGVDLYSCAEGKVDSRLKGNGHSGEVTSICLHNDSTLYTSGTDCQIFEWSLADGCAQSHFSIGTAVPTCIVSLPKSNSLLVGSRELFQWSLGKRPELISTFAGHPSDVNSMKMLELTERNEEYVVTTAKSNREIFLWKIGGKKKDPRGTFLMEYTATYVSCSLVGRKLMIAAVTGATAGGVVHLFTVEDIRNIKVEGSKKPLNPKVTLAVAFDSGSTHGVVPIPIVAATPNFSGSQNILIGYGNSPTICFEDIQYNPNAKKQTLEREDPRIQVNRQEKTKEQFKTIVPITNDNNTQYHTGSVKSKSGKKSLASELSLDDRLKTLSVGEDDDAKGHSLVELLKQGLHNRDATILRTVLSTKDENVIRSTLKRLPTQFVPSLIDELTMLTNKKTVNVQIAVRWLRFLLQIHASQLMALGKNELYDRFGEFLGIIKLRTNCLVPLTELSGRLDFLLNQIKRNTDDDPIFNHENLLVFEDEASDGEHSHDKLNIDEADSTDEDDVDMVNGDGSTDEGDSGDDSMDDK